MTSTFENITFLLVNYVSMHAHIIYMYRHMSVKMLSLEVIGQLGVSAFLLIWWSQGLYLGHQVFHYVPLLPEPCFR